MLFSKSVAIPAKRTKANPLVTTFPICEGVIKRVWVRWRWGSGNLCGCRLFYESFQVWPLSMTEWFVSSPTELVFDEDYEIDDVPHEMRLEAYNEDDIFPHTLWIACSILRPGGSTRLSDFIDFMTKGG